MNNRKYCCYRHFKEGKHDPSCTHCFSHVPLGIINPTHNPPNNLPNNGIPPLQIRSKPFRIENRTYDYNQVQNKESIPKRLRQPRIYVEKIISKFDRTQPLLPIKHSGSNQYELAVRYFRKIGESLSQKSKQQLNEVIKLYCNEKNINYTSLKTKTSKNNIFLTKQQFIEFIMEKFKKFTYQDAEIFWTISYNELRFKERISMEAFVFNFGKFYLELQNYNNTFSQAALRQRVIDLRILMFDWFHNDVCIKYNMREIREKVFQIQKELKFNEGEQTYCDFHFLVEQCKKSHIKLRFFAETFFALTDNKYLSAQKLKNAIEQKISQRSKRISTSRQILKKYFQTNDYGQTDKFAVTNIIQFCKLENCNEKVIMDMVSWIQGIFQYLYYYRTYISDDIQESEEFQQLGLSLNFQSRRLQCANILHIDAVLIREYDRFLQTLYDEQVQICKSLTAMINSTFERIPHLQGHKKNVVQCNYIAETLLRYIRSADLSCFWYVNKIFVDYRQGQNCQIIKQILKEKPREQEIKKNMKGLFAFPSNSQNQIKRNQNSQGSLYIRTQQSNENDKIKNIIKGYEKISQEKLALKIKQKIKEVNEQQNPVDNVLKVLGPPSENIHDENTELDNCKSMCTNHVNCKCQTKYWIQASKQVNDTISTIESLESQLFSLLKCDQC